MARFALGRKQGQSAGAAAVALLLVASASAVGGVRGHTEPLDPAGMAARAPVALGFFNERHGLLATAGGRLLVTDDGGSSWRQDARLALRAIEVISDSVAYATTKRALLRTDDGGAHWRLVARVAGPLSFGDQEHGWVGTMATDDGGKSWRRLSFPCSGPDAWFALSRVSAELGFAACGSQPGAGEQPKRLYVTHDGGRSWRGRAGERQLPGSGYLSTISFADASNGLMTTERGGLLATRDGGHAWRMLLFTDDGTEVVTAQRLGPRGLVALLLNGALLRSGDAGAHWRPVYPHTLPAPGAVSFTSEREGIGIGFADWAYSRWAILVTHDGGRSWRLRSTLPGELDPFALARASAEIVYLVASSNRRIGTELLRSSDDGRSWRRLATPRRSAFFAVSFPTRLDGVLADDAGRFYATHDGARTWTLIRRGGQDLRDFAFLTRTRGLSLFFSESGAQSALYETRDGGRSWHRYTRVPVRRPIAFATLGAGHVWIVDTLPCQAAVLRRRPSCPGAIVRTADGGRSWQRIELNTIPGSGSPDFVTPQVGYALPWRTRDGGRDWTLVR